MLDLDPPHEKTHTWTAFFFHIATIIVGLFVAIGLEQTVEAIHRHRELVLLQSELRQEALHNRAIAEGDLLWMNRQILWLLEVKDALDSISSANSDPVMLPAKPQLPKGAVVDEDLVLTAWKIAGEDTTVALLPHDDAMRYSNAYAAAEQERREDALATAAGMHFESFFVGGLRGSGDLDLTHLSPADREAVARTTAELLATLRQQKNAMAVFYGMNENAISGDTNATAFNRHKNEILQRYPDPYIGNDTASYFGR